MPENAESAALPAASLRKLVLDTITLHPELQKSEPDLRCARTCPLACCPPRQASPAAPINLFPGQTPLSGGGVTFAS